MSISFTTKADLVLKADMVKYDGNFDSITAEGNIYITLDSYILTADKLYYDSKKDILFAEGNIRIKDQEGKIILAERAILKDKLKKGIIYQMVLRTPDGSTFVAAYTERHSAKTGNFYKSTFTPCKITCNRNPIWQIKAEDINVDYEKDRITYKNVFFEIYGVPVIISPYFSHPTPKAPAQSGILVPHFRNKGVIIPIYFRAMSNLDFTISPYISKNYIIIESDFRHLLKDGAYQINASSGNPSFNEEKDSELTRYHVFAKGDFNREDINYGFDLNRVSDKSYLKNYFNNHESYLESRLYANKVNHGDYSSIEAYSFEGLREQDTKKNNPLIFPRIRNQKIIAFNEDDTLFFKIKNDAIAYNQNYDKQLARNSLKLEINKNIITNHGHLINFTLSNRNDLYLLSLKNNITNSTTQKIWNRNIPELRAKWRYPIVRSFFNNIAIKLEPIIDTTIGVNYSKKFDKFALVDIANYELSEYNLFNSNRFSGIDYHDYGQRFSYGMNGSIYSDPYYVDLFLGQLLYKNNIVEKGNGELVGSASFDVSNNFKLYYRFRRGVDLKPIRDEVGLSTSYNKLTTNLVFSKLNDISKYYSDDNFKFPGNKVVQVNFKIGYQLLDSLKIETGANFDITKKNDILERSIMVTYAMDCVSIIGGFSDDFTHDQNRGVKKIRTNTYKIGLKVLNM